MQLDQLLAPDRRLVHELGCETLRAPPLATPRFEEDIKTDRDDLIGYSMSVRPCYDRINRVIGQLAGLLILANARGRLELDFEATSSVIVQIEEVGDRLRSVNAPASARSHHLMLLSVQKSIEGVVSEFDRAGLNNTQMQEALSSWIDRLKHAHRKLKATSVEKLGMLPVDFSHACCNCGSMPDSYAHKS